MKQSEVAEMVGIAIDRSGEPVKAIARNMGMSIDSLYAAVRGTRHVPMKLMQAFSKINMIAAASMAAQSTGLMKLFRYRKSDRHIQSRLIEWRKIDRESDAAVSKLPEMLFNKNSKEDLTDEDIAAIYDAADKLAVNMNVMINLLIELDVRYGLNLVKQLEKK